jgi:hypothetical protein
MNLIKMRRDTAPFTADVHPDEADNYRKGGWYVAPEPPPLVVIEFNGEPESANVATAEEWEPQVTPAPIKAEPEPVPTPKLKRRK